jgi:hypothetical protein
MSSLNHTSPIHRSSKDRCKVTLACINSLQITITKTPPRKALELVHLGIQLANLKLQLAEQSAKKIQHTWRNQWKLKLTMQKWPGQWKQALLRTKVLTYVNSTTFMSMDKVLGPQLDGQRIPIPFNDLLEHLRKSDFIKSLKTVLQAIHVTDINHDKVLFLPDIFNPPNINVRRFAAAYMIWHYPLNVFEYPSQNLEQLLSQATLEMLPQFDLIINTIATTPQNLPFDYSIQVAPIASGFTHKLSKYIDAFNNWKIPDEEKLCKRIYDALFALYDSRKGYPHDDPILIPTNTQIDKLRDKLSQVAGPLELEKFDQDLILRTLRIADLAAAALLIHDHHPINSHYFTSLTLPSADIPQNEAIAYECQIDHAYRIPDMLPKISSTTDIAAQAILHHAINSQFTNLWQSIRDQMVLSLKPQSVMLLPIHFMNYDQFKQSLENQQIHWDFYFNIINDLILAIRISVYPHRIDLFNSKSLSIKLAYDNATLLHDDQILATLFTSTLADFILNDTLANIHIDLQNTR